MPLVRTVLEEVSSLARLALLAVLLAGCVAERESRVYGTWAVSWDREGTGWTPRFWHGTLVLRPAAVDVAWLTSSGSDVGKWELRSYVVDGDRATIEYGWLESSDASHFTLVVEATEDSLVGTQAASGDANQGPVPPVPVRGKRVAPMAVR